VLTVAWEPRSIAADVATAKHILVAVAPEALARAKSPACAEGARDSLDCDEDVVLLEVEQVGGIACHTAASCFFYELRNGTGSKLMRC